MGGNKSWKWRKGWYEIWYVPVFVSVAGLKYSPPHASVSFGKHAGTHGSLSTYKRPRSRSWWQSQIPHQHLPMNKARPSSRPKTRSPCSGPWRTRTARLCLVPKSQRKTPMPDNPLRKTPSVTNDNYTSSNTIHFLMSISSMLIRWLGRQTHRGSVGLPRVRKRLHGQSQLVSGYRGNGSTRYVNQRLAVHVLK